MPLQLDGEVQALCHVRLPRFCCAVSTSIKATVLLLSCPIYISMSEIDSLAVPVNNDKLGGLARMLHRYDVQRIISGHEAFLLGSLLSTCALYVGLDR